MRNIYKETMRDIYHKTAEKIFNGYQLSPNFDIVNLLHKLDFEVIPVAKLPYDWEYAFNTDSGKLKIYYHETLLAFSEAEKEKYKKSVDYYQKDTRFILAMALADIMAFYRLEETNIIKGELDGITYFQGKTNGNHQDYALREWELNEFAASILMPPKLTKEKFNELAWMHENYQISPEDMIFLSEMFGVNTKAMYTRCRSLKLIY